ncbi:MAG: hypothetical protein ACRETX_07345 [Steroidobacteraceae bacterium]
MRQETRRRFTAVIGLSLLVAALFALPAAASPDTNASGQIRIDGTGDVSYTVHRPDGWTCEETDLSSFLKVSCVPNDPSPSGSWVCPNPSVMASYFGSPANTLIATVRCGSASASCHPQAVPLVQNYCIDHVAGPAPVPLKCEVDYSGMLPPDQWTVLCRTYSF